MNNCIIPEDVSKRQNELLDNLPYGAGLYELNNGKLSAIHLNKQYWQLVGREEDKDTTAHFINSVYPDDREIIKRELSAAIKNKRDVVCEIRILCGNGNYRPFRVVGRIVEKGEGRYYIYVTHTSITDQAISIQNTLAIALKTVMETQSDFSFIKDRDLRYISCSRASLTANGIDNEIDIIGKTDYELFSKEQADLYNDEAMKVLTSGEPEFDKEITLHNEVAPDNYFNFSIYPLKDADGNTIGIYGLGHDITEAKNIKSQLELLMNNLPGGITTYETTHGNFENIKLTFFSDGLCRMFGYSREEYRKRADANPLCLIIPEDIQKLRTQIFAVMNGERGMDCIFRVRIKDGTLKWINLKGMVAKNIGDTVRVNAVLFDVTEQQKALESLRISEEENRLAIKLSECFICRFSVADRCATLLPEVAEQLNLPSVIEGLPYGPVKQGLIAQESIDTYIGFYNSIIEGNKYGSAVYKEKYNGIWRWMKARYTTIFSDDKPISALIIFNDVTEELEKEAIYKRWQQTQKSKDPHMYSLFRCNISKNEVIGGNEGFMKKPEDGSDITNLDERSILYTAASVFDEDKEKFFNTVKTGVLLAEYYQGKREITLEYRENQSVGKYRWIKLTIELIDSAVSSDIEAYFLFEDIDKAKRMELAIIERAETDPLTGLLNRATFAEKVNELIRNLKPGKKHALMMLDIDGFKLVNDIFGHGTGDRTLIDISNILRNSLRRDDLIGRLGGDEFLIFMNDIPERRIAAEKARQICERSRKILSADVQISGSIGITIAPDDGADFETLYQKVDETMYYVKNTGKDNFSFYKNNIIEATDDDTLKATDSGTQKMPLRTLRKRHRMLIVDDSQLDVVMLSAMFDSEYKIDTASDGASALAKLRHYGSAISVVLLDLNMPGINGFAVLERMKKKNETNSVPVIVVSGDSNHETCLKAIRAGATDYITKPIDSDLLRLRVKSAIGKAEYEHLRIQNDYLRMQSNELECYKTVLEKTGTLLIEHDMNNGTYKYSPSVQRILYGMYDDRTLWRIFLSDFVADANTVKKMQELEFGVAEDRKKNTGSVTVQLKTSSGRNSMFEMNVYKQTDEFGLAEKMIMSFTEINVSDVMR